MINDQTTSKASSKDTEAPSKHHRCPWFIHYLLASPIRRLFESPQKMVGSYIKPGMTVLDVGCGFGFMSLPVAKMVGSEGKVIGVDVEAPVVERMKKRARKAKLDHIIEGRACGETDLGLADYEGNVDFIMVIHTFHEISDQTKFLQQARRLLKPTGQLLIIEPPGHVSSKKYEEQEKLCLDAGFEKLEAPELAKKPMAILLSPISG